MLKSSLFSLLPHKGRAGITWRARGVFRTRSQFVPQMTPTRQLESVCLRWRRTSGAAQQLRSSRGQVSFCKIAVCTFCCTFQPLLCQPSSTLRSRTNKWSFHVPRKLLNHCFLPFHPTDNCHMVWKLSHNWSKCSVAIIQARGMPLFLAIILSFWPDCSGTLPVFLPATFKAIEFTRNMC